MLRPDGLDRFVYGGTHGGPFPSPIEAVGKPRAGASGNLWPSGERCARNSPGTLAGATQSLRICPETLLSRIPPARGDADARASAGALFVAMVPRHREPTPLEAWQVDPQAARVC